MKINLLTRHQSEASREISLTITPDQHLFFRQIALRAQQLKKAQSDLNISVVLAQDHASFTLKQLDFSVESVSFDIARGSPRFNVVLHNRGKTKCLILSNLTQQEWQAMAQLDVSQSCCGECHSPLSDTEKLAAVTICQSCVDLTMTRLNQKLGVIA